MSTTRKVITISLTSIALICLIIIFFIGSLVNLNTLIDGAQFAACQPSQAISFFSKGKQILWVCAIMIWASAFSDICILLAKAFLHSGRQKGKLKNKGQIAAIILGGSSCICSIIIFGDCVKAYVNINRAYSCAQDSNQAETFFKYISILLMVSSFLLLAHFLNLIVLSLPPKASESSNIQNFTSDFPGKNPMKQQGDSRAQLIHDQATQVQTPPNKAKRTKIFDRKRVASPTQQQDTKQQGMRIASDSHQMLIHPDQIIVEAEVFSRTSRDQNSLCKNQSNRYKINANQ